MIDILLFFKNNLIEFESWKHSIERETVSMYMLDIGAKNWFIKFIS